MNGKHLFFGVIFVIFAALAVVSIKASGLSLYNGSTLVLCAFFAIASFKRLKD